MARRRIGLFMSEISQYFQEYCGKAIIRLAAERDIDVIIFSSFGSYSCPYGRNLLSEMGKKNILHLPDYSTLDAIIAMPNSFDIYGMDSEFYEMLKKNATCPVICLQSGSPDHHLVSIDNRDTMYRMTKHFIEQHDHSTICYMSGPFKSKDSPDRLHGFEQAMEEAGLPIRQNTIYEGNYWTNRGARALDFFLGGGDKYPDAIICANDYMALSVIDELKKRGLRVPDDVCVTGFDGILESEYSDPPLTTVKIKPEDYAIGAFELLDKLLSEDASLTAAPETVTIPADILFRESCGCPDTATPFYDKAEGLRRIVQSDILLREAGRITGDYQNKYDIDNALSVANYYLWTIGCSTGYLCLCDETDPVFRSVEQNRIFSDEMILMQIMRTEDQLAAETVDMRFPRSEVLPHELTGDSKPGGYIVFPISYKNKSYGYLVLKPDEGEWPNALTNTYINALAAAIENFFYQDQFMELAEIKRLSETDPLTGLYNRRGFENALTEILASYSEGKTISLASIDMDNLKLINDIYGHADGDYALKTLSDVLKTCLRDGEICARFGGDEFSAVLISDHPDHDRIEEFADIFGRRLSEVSKTTGKPYPIHASVGISDLKGGDTKHIFACMQLADERMYVNKRNYKMTMR